MRTRNKALIAGAAVVALGAGGAGYAIATGDDENAAPIRGAALERAGAAALQHTGGGTVTETEVGDEESYYEVEVTQDGGQTDVQLNRDFEVVGSEGDGAEDEGAGDD
jgi:uncharacterized membrane protein YkoI